MEEPRAESSALGTHGRSSEPPLPSTRGQAGGGWGCSSRGGRAGTRLHLIITDNCCRRFLAKSALHLQSQAGEPHSETPAASPEVAAEPGQTQEKSSGEPKGGQEHQLLCKLALCNHGYGGLVQPHERVGPLACSMRGSQEGSCALSPYFYNRCTPQLLRVGIPEVGRVAVPSRDLEDGARAELEPRCSSVRQPKTDQGFTVF